MKKNSSNSTPNVSLSNEMKGLILSYMEACNAGDKVKETALLDAIKKQGIIDHESHT